MTSQTDLDQGGTVRQWIRQYLGPSIGWVDAPGQNYLVITAGGTYNVSPGTNYITVNTTGAVTINLPAAADPTYQGAPQAQPGLFTNPPIVIVDVGGNAQAHPITIQPAAGETIMGLANIRITVNFGGFTLAPVPSQLTWNSISP